MKEQELASFIARNILAFFGERPASFAQLTDELDVSKALAIAKQAKKSGNAFGATFATLSVPVAMLDDKMLSGLAQDVCKLDYHRFEGIFLPVFEEFHRRKKSAESANMLIDYLARTGKVFDAWNLAYQTRFNSLSRRSFCTLAHIIEAAFRHAKEDTTSAEERKILTSVDQGSRERDFVYSLMRRFAKEKSGDVFQRSLFHCGVALETCYVENKDYKHALDIAKEANFPSSEINELEKQANSEGFVAAWRKKALGYGVFFGSTVSLYGFYVHLLRGVPFDESVGVFTIHSLLPLAVGAYNILWAERLKGMSREAMRWVSTRRTWLFFVFLMPLCPMWISLVVGTVYFFLAIKFVPDYLMWRWYESMPDDLKKIAEEVTESIEKSGGAE